MGVEVMFLGLLVTIILFAFAYLWVVKWEVSTRQAPKPPHTTETLVPHSASVTASTNTSTRAQRLKVWVMSSVGSTVRIAIALALIAGLIVGVKYMDVTTWFVTATQGVPSKIIFAGLILLAIAVTESYKSGGVEAKWITRLLVMGLVFYVILFFVFGEKVNNVIGTFQEYNAETIFNPQPSNVRSPVSPKVETFVASTTDYTTVYGRPGKCLSLKTNNPGEDDLEIMVTIPTRKGWITEDEYKALKAMGYNEFTNMKVRGKKNGVMVMYSYAEYGTCG